MLYLYSVHHSGVFCAHVLMYVAMTLQWRLRERVQDSNCRYRGERSTHLL